MLAERYDAFLLDLDGVLYRADRVVEGAPAVVERLRSLGRGIVFVTNNSARTPIQVAAKLRGLGIDASAEEVVTSALATADLLRNEGSRSAFVIGEDGIRTALEDVGIRVVDDGPEGVDVVVVGWDRGITYDKLRDAALAVQRGARLVATNADASYPAPDGRWPGAGALLSVVTTTTGATPTIVGKPHAPLLQAARARGGGNTQLVVGDRLDTDIVGAAAVGLDALLVLTGISSARDAERADVRPTYVAETLNALFAEPEPPRLDEAARQR